MEEKLKCMTQMVDMGVIYNMKEDSMTAMTAVINSFCEKKLEETPVEPTETNEPTNDGMLESLIVIDSEGKNSYDNLEHQANNVDWNHEFIKLAHENREAQRQI